MTTTALIFKDPIYGVNGTRDFPGNASEVEEWFFEFDMDLKNFIDTYCSVNYFLADSEKWSGVQNKRYEAESCNEEIDENFCDVVLNYFIARYTPIAHWTPLELWMSLFYKQLCYQTNPYKGALFDLEREAYDITNLHLSFEVKKCLLDKDIQGALVWFGKSWIKDNYDRPFDSRNLSVLFHFINYNPNQRDKIKKEIAGLFERNTWIFDIPENKSSLISFVSETLNFKQPYLKELKTINKDTLEVAVKTFFETLIFIFMLGFPQWDLTPYKDVFVERMLESLKVESEKEKIKSKEIFELKEKLKNLENQISESKKVEGILRSETIKEIIREIKETLKNNKGNN